jgi:UDP-3-O-[3-hydroxymyristoyl] glucosamine N-acyltransferase
MQTVQSIADAVGAVLDEGMSQDSREKVIARVSGLAAAGANALVFIENGAMLGEALASGASAIITPINIAAGEYARPLLRVKQPKLAFARAARLLAKRKPMEIHPSAVIGKASIGKGTAIGAGCVLADDISIGEGCTLYPRVTVYGGVTIGDRVVVHAGAVLGADGFGYVRDAQTGEYLQFPQQGTLVIEDDVEIGANTTIDRGALEETRIGRGTKIDNLVHVGHNVRVGRNVVIAAQTGISGSTLIGDGAVIGGHVGMGDHAMVGEGVIVGSGAGILPHKKLNGPGQMFWGVPAKPLKTHLRELATLARLARKASVREEE